MIQAKEELRQALAAALTEIAPAHLHNLAPDFESPRQASHGDLASAAAMQLARPLKRNPRELANELIAALLAQPAVQRWVESADIAGPGFVNLTLKLAAKQAVVGEVRAAGARFGQRSGDGARVLVEFVSANPTG